LQVGQAGVEVGRDRGQGGVDDSGIEEGDAGAEDRGGDDPPALRRAEADGGPDGRLGGLGGDAADRTADPSSVLRRDRSRGP
jgi:hypothetical protein